MAEAIVWLSWDISTDCENECRKELEEWLNKYEFVITDNKKNKDYIIEKNDTKLKKDFLDMLPESFCVFVFPFDYNDYKYDCFTALTKELKLIFEDCNCTTKCYAVCYIENKNLIKYGSII